MANDGSSAVWQRELKLLPPDPWRGRLPGEPPTGAMQPHAVEQQREVEGTRGGRERGSTNKRADDMTSYIGRRYGDPLEHLARKSMQPVGDLARECGVSRLVAFDFRCAVERL